MDEEWLWRIVLPVSQRALPGVLSVLMNLVMPVLSGNIVIIKEMSEFFQIVITYILGVHKRSPALLKTYWQNGMG